MGVMLFMLVEASFPFTELDDIWYRRLQKDPKLYMKARKREMDVTFLELVAGMIRKDPAERFTVQDIAASAWMQGEMVSEEDIKNHFYELKAKQNDDYQMNYEANHAAKNKFSSGASVNRGQNSLSDEAFKEIKDVWDELKYFASDNSEAQTKGFKTVSKGTTVFAAMWRYLEALEDEETPEFMLKSDPSVSENSFKMTFDVQSL